MPWSEWLTECHYLLGRGADEPVKLEQRWRRLRERVLAGLDGLGLAATVVRTDGAAPLADHLADQAGLVRVHRRGQGWAPAHPSLPGWTWFADGQEAQHARRMLAHHGLLSMRGSIPTSLRQFCGQRADHQCLDTDWTSVAGGTMQRVAELDFMGDWFDHVRTWIDRDSQPVLTLEPYGRTLVADDFVAWLHARLVDTARLPLLIDGPHPGMWSDRTTLVILRQNPETGVLPAEYVLPPMRYKTSTGRVIEVAR